MDDFNQKNLPDEETLSSSEVIAPKHSGDPETNRKTDISVTPSPKDAAGSPSDSAVQKQIPQTNTEQQPKNQAPWQPQDPIQDSGNWQQGQEQNYPNPENWQQGQNYPSPESWQQGQGQNYPNPENRQQGQGQNYPNPGNWQQGQMPPAPGQNPYYQTPPQGYYYYGQPDPGMQGQPNPPQPKPPANNMAVTSMVLGLVSLLISCCCFPIGFIIGFALGMGGLVLSVLSRKGKPFSGFAVAGLVLSILGICVSLFIFICYLITANLMQDPEYAALFNEILRQYYNGN